MRVSCDGADMWIFGNFFAAFERRTKNWSTIIHPRKVAGGYDVSLLSGATNAVATCSIFYATVMVVEDCAAFRIR